MDNRLAELERRIAALESAALSTGPEGTEAVLAEAERAGPQLAERDGWASLAGVLAALGNPVRLTLLQEIVRGRATVSALSEVDGLGTSGQIYHHLRQLTAEGWLHSPSRGTFAVPPPRVVALLAILEALQR
ncbi:winged helix-turn-helix transcriptional regulator [Streptomyces sp. SID13031]|nr:winged helix-turn-helix transcriptional regulator [Streptomyces sp. SID13031]